MNVLRNAGDAAKGDNRNRRGHRGAGTQGRVRQAVHFLDSELFSQPTKRPVKYQEVDQILPRK